MGGFAYASPHMEVRGQPMGTGFLLHLLEKTWGIRLSRLTGLSSVLFSESLTQARLSSPYPLPRLFLPSAESMSDGDTRFNLEPPYGSALAPIARPMWPPSLI